MENLLVLDHQSVTLPTRFSFSSGTFLKSCCGRGNRIQQEEILSITFLCLEEN
jgi:hypothetical protein